MPAYPILLDVTRLRVVIVGGGEVARRKALGLLAAGASDVTVVAPALAEDFPPVRHVTSLYTPQTIADAKLVFAATSDPAVNAAIVADARAVGALANRADTDLDHPGDFVLPAVVREGPLTITVSAGSAALSAAVRDDVRLRLDPRWGKMADAMAVLRPFLRDRAGLSPTQRAAAFRRLAGHEALDVLDREGTAGLLLWVNQTLPADDKPRGER